MFMGIGSAAGPAPLPDAASAGDALAAADDTEFDAALTATLQGSQPVQRAAGTRAEEEPSRLFTDPLALAEWLLVGTPVQKDEAAAAATSSADVREEDEDATPAKVDGNALWEIPIDGLLAMTAAAPELREPQAAISVAGDAVVTVTPTLDATIRDARGVGSIAGNTQAPQPQAATDIADAPAAGEQNEQAATALDATGTAVDAAQANGAQNTRIVKRTTAGAAVERKQPQVTTSKAEVAAKTSEVVEKTADVAGENGAVDAGHIAGSLRVKVNTRHTPQAPAAVTAQAVAAAVVAAAGQRDAVSAVVVGAQQDVRDPAAPVAKQNALTPVVPQLQPQMNGGGDTAQAFGESEGRRSGAAARLAAALSMAATEKADASPQAAPFTVAAAPAAAPLTSMSQVVATAPVTAAEMTPDADNVSTLVEAMRITAKAGGWEATVRLKPQHLGEVSIALRVDGNNVSAVVNAEASGVRQWLASQEDAVRSGMAEHGLNLASFQVTRDGQRRQPHEQEPQRRRQSHRRTTGVTERFEIVV